MPATFFFCSAVVRLIESRKSESTPLVKESRVNRPSKKSRTAHLYLPTYAFPDNKIIHK